jgi:hypothetical protein
MTYKRSLLLILVALAFCPALATGTHAASVNALVVQTDTTDYAPGDSVVITGDGFWPGETIQVQVTHQTGLISGEGHLPWMVVADASGKFETFWIVPGDDNVNQVLVVTATGLSSGLVATTTFTDGNTVLQFTTPLPDSLCAGTQLHVCANLTENCGGGNGAPLPNRMVLFFPNPGSCGNNVGQNADDSVLTDANGNACATITLPSTLGNYSIRIKFRGEDKPGPIDPPNGACTPGSRVELSTSNDCGRFEIVQQVGTPPVVTLPPDTTVRLCAPGQICLPYTVEDADCDIEDDGDSSGSSNTGGRRWIFDASATAASVPVDQVDLINRLGGTISQVGGGASGKTLQKATDFVPSINTLSGVKVTLPGYHFATGVSRYGSFPSGTLEVQSADQLVGAPTKIAYTLVGSGGPDNSAGDGSVTFSQGNHVTMSFSGDEESCDDDNEDAIIFGSSRTGGTAQFTFLRNGLPVFVLTKTVTASSSWNAVGGVLINLPTGVRYNEVDIKCVSGQFEVDAIAARSSSSDPSDQDTCFTADTSGVYTIIVSRSDMCGQIGADTTHVTVHLNHAPVANAGADFSKFLCTLSQICFPVSLTDQDNNIKTTSLVSGPGTLSAGQICFTPGAAGAYTFIVDVTDSCNASDRDTVVVTVTLNQPPVAVNPSNQTVFQCVAAQLCYTFTATDPNGGPLTWVKLAGAGTITSGGQFCFTPTTSGTYSATVVVSDSCGAKDTTSIQYAVTINSAPVAVDPATPVSLTQCAVGQVCYQFSASDPNGGTLTWTKLSGSGSVTTSGNWCFTPSGSGSYSVTAQVADSCGKADTTTLTYNMTVNAPPVISLGSDSSVVLCASGQICKTYTVSDPNGSAHLSEAMVSGYGSIDTANNRICFTPVSSGTYQFVVSVTDSCGAIDLDTVVLTVTLNQPPVAVNPSNQTVFQCVAAQLCYTFTATDPNGGPLTWVKLAGAGTITSGGQFCFTPTTSGTYSATVVVSDSCGAKDTTSIQYAVTINSAPVAVDPATPVSLTQCAVGQVCYQFSASDPNGGTLTWTKLSGSGSVTTSGNWCFTPSGSGSYSVTAQVADSCGKADTTTLTYNMTVNAPPVISLGSDSSVVLCASGQICKTYTVSDPNGSAHLSEAMVSGYGSIDTANNRICFTPVSSGTYQFVVSVTDSCGAIDLDTAVITVTLGQAAVIDCPTGPISVGLCAPGQVCQALAITPANATVTVSPAGTYSGGQLCFSAATTGTYNIRVIASTSCGNDTCDLTFNVNISSPPTVTCPQPFSEFVCSAGSTVCVPVGIAGTGATVTVSPIGSWSAGNLCFNADTSGHYVLKVKATSTCGTDSCFVTVNVTINDVPVAVNPPATVDTFLCSSAQICRQLAATDPNGNPLTWTRLSGSGSVSSSGLWCFTASTSGPYAVVARVADSCGAADTVTMTYNVSLNSAPTLSLGNDTSIFQCAAELFCRTYVYSDPNNNIQSLSLVSGPGVLNPTLHELCFTPTVAGTYTFVMSVTDSCQVSAYDTLRVQVSLNQPPVAVNPPNQTVLQCAAEQLCYTFTATDSNGGALTWSKLTGVGTITSDGQFCFTPTASGTYSATMVVSDPCGAKDTASIQYTVTINGVPVAVNPPATVDTFLCSSAQICRQLAATDPNGNPLTWTRLSGSGSVSSSGLWCFTASTSGPYAVVARVADSCGAADTVTMTYNVSLNSAPTLSLGNDTSIFQCAAELFCRTYVYSDPNNNIQSLSLVSGPGVLNPTLHELCFTPTVAGTYTFVMSITDSCQVSAYDTLRVQVSLNQPPVANAGADQVIFKCANTTLCWAAGATDQDNNLTSVQLVTGPTGAYYSGGQICFTPTQTWNYEFVLKATDACGATDLDTVVVYYTLNTPPVANAGPDQTLFQCTPTQICWPVSCTDADGNLIACSLVSGIGSYDGSQICFTPTTSGSYQFILKATDACGATDYDTAVINVTVNVAPVCNVPNDTSIFRCTPSQICLPVSATDANNNLAGCSIVSGPGALVNGTWCYTPSASQLVTVVVNCADSCGASCQTQFTVDIKVNTAPSIAFAQYNPMFLCAPQQICLDFTASDPDVPRPVTITLTGGGTLDLANSRVCFSADTTGTYKFILHVQDECGAFDADTIAVGISINRPPVANAGPDQTLFLCGPTQICWPASCTDPDNNQTQCAFTGPGAFDGSNICFTPTASGAYLFIIHSEDGCYAASTDTAVITVVMNQPPTIAFGNDTSIFLCTPQQLCFGYTVSDPDGLHKVVETMVSGFGSIDTANNRVCFTPGTAGAYQFIVRATDSCGDFDDDTLNVTVELGQRPKITCPTGPISIAYCAADSVCYGLPISPTGATVTASQGVYHNGQLCFYAGASGTYNIQVIASNSCGADTCNLTFNVTIGSGPTISCPGPQYRFLCHADSVDVPVTIMGTNPSVTVLPSGAYANGTVRFWTATSGVYNLTIIATTPCGADTCHVQVTVKINRPPVAIDPPAVVDTFMCAGGPICRFFSAADPDSTTVTWSRLSGAGTVSSSGQWCFTANTAGSYSVVATVSDSCGAKDTVSMTYNVTLNSPPVVQFGNDTTIFQCTLTQICLPYTVADPNNGVKLEQLVSGTGAIDTAANHVCFTPSGAGTFTFIVKVTDNCDATDVDTINVTVGVNHPPTVNAGTDKSIYQCSPAQYCFGVSVTDIDNNLDSVILVSGPGSYANGQICFTPTQSGQVTFILRAVDKCRLATIDTVRVTVGLNAAPVCQTPHDTTKYFQCIPTQVSLPVTATDINGNFDRCELLSGPGSLVAGQWVYTPSGTETVKVKVQCLDSCGAVCIDSFYVKFTVNRPPVAHAGPDSVFFLCASGTVCVPVSCSDVDGNLKTCEMVSTVGTYDPGTGRVCITSDFGTGSSKIYPIIMKATDSCGAVDYDTSFVTINFNHPPVVQGPPNFTAFIDKVGQLCFDVIFSDPDNNCPIDSIRITPVGTYNPTTHQVCFDADTTGHYCLILSATDYCGAKKADTVCIDVQIDQCIHVQIEKADKTPQGQHRLLNIFLNGSGRKLAGFDFVIAYDPSVLTAVAAVPGSLYAGCGWEYFTYRFGPFGNCGSACPSGLLRIDAIAETNNGAYHPSCFLDDQTGPLAAIDFLVSNDRTYECQFAPVSFFWFDCGDNAFSNIRGDTMYVSRHVFDYRLNDITNNTFGFPGLYGAPDNCLIGGGSDKPSPMRCVDFVDGGIGIICAEDIDARGDVNLNGMSYEIADAVMFTNYFIQGVSAFGNHAAGSVAATDVNADGLTLTVADLVYLIRVVVGDAPPTPKPNPNAANSVSFSIMNGVLEISETSTSVGAIYLQLEGRYEPKLSSTVDGVDLFSRYDGSVTRVLITTKGKAALQTGAVLDLGGARTIKSIEVGSFDGCVMIAKISTLPSEYSLSQNYPNPFNPITTIEFALPRAGDWHIDIYNILGQVVSNWSSRDEAGYYKLTWDASSHSSGVYFYRLTVGAYSSTKKMVLLK